MNDHPDTGFWRSKAGIVCAGFLAIAAFFLITEHTAHVLGALPWQLFAACPLMHLFMHHGHGSHDHGTHTDAKPSDVPQASGERR
jgi:hypothetical protein